ncbi:putative quinol monooxygenase [Kitasatospora sp. NPDC006697]|uniref:putative quinol monooxygenase n=1 Tax=Kitasatospora sp. NPDC006697 TaxID=3364020 RepID=UPI0036C278FF
MYQVAVAFEVAADRREDFIAAVLEDSRRSTADEPGTLRFELVEDDERPTRFYLNEAYEDEAAFIAHCEGPNFQRFFETVQGYAQGPSWLLRGSLITER